MLDAAPSDIHAFLLRERKYCFQKLTKFSQGNNVLDEPASHIDAYLWRDTCVSASQLKRPSRSKQSFPVP
jgi:hypothetical protein